jgi:hypothetical protein
MDERKELSLAARRAIWEAHGRRCAYTSEPIDWSELEIDHIVAVKGDEKEKAALRDKGILSAEFDVNGFENLLPMKGSRNRQKSNDLGSERFIVYFLDVAAKAKPKVERLLASSVEADLGLKSYLQLKIQGERNEIDFDDVVAFLRHQSEGEVPLRVSPEIDGPSISKANSQFAAVLMDKPFALGRGSIREVVLQTDGGGRAICTTANEFLDAKAKGFWPLTQYDITCFGLADQTSELLRAIKDSVYAKTSQLRAPVITLKNLDRWSAEWAASCFVFGTDFDMDASRYPTLAALADAKLVQVAEQSEWSLTLDSDYGFSVLVHELMRADLDGDTNEEILVFSFAFAREGSFRAGSVLRAKPNEAGLLIPLPI